MFRTNVDLIDGNCAPQRAQVSKSAPSWCALGHAGRVTALAWTASGQLLTVGLGRSIVLWNVRAARWTPGQRTHAQSRLVASITGVCYVAQ